MRRARGAQVLRQHRSAAQPRRAQIVDDRQRSEPAIDCGVELRALQLDARTRQQQFGPGQHRVDFHRLDAAIHQIERALGRTRQRCGPCEHAAAQRTAACRAVGDDRNLVAARALRGRAQHVAREDLPRQIVAPGPVFQLERGELAAIVGRRRPAVPFRKAALAAGARGDIALHPGQRGQQAVLGRVVDEIERELVPVGLAVEPQAQPITPAEAATETHQSMAAADIGARGKVDPPPLAHNAAIHGEVLGRKLVDANIEIGQDRLVRIARLQARRAQQRPAFQDQRADVEALEQPRARIEPEPRQRPPVERSLRHDHEAAIGIAQYHFVQTHRAQQRSVDAPDADPEPR